MCFAKNGAPPIFLQCMANGFVANKHNVYCVLSAAVRNNDMFLQNISPDVHCLFIDTGDRRTVTWKTFGFLLREKRRILEFIGNGRIDISIQTFVHPWMDIINQWIKPSHAMCINHDPVNHSGEERVTVYLNRVLYALVPETIVMTESFISVIESLYGKKRESVYYMRHGLYDTYKSAQKLMQGKIYRDDCVNFVFFGRIEKYKGLKVLVDSFYALLRDCGNITLSIYGAGDLYEIVEPPETDKIHIENRYIEDEEIGDIFSGPNLIAVVPYLDATQSGVIPIAIDYEVPIIASDSGGLREQLDGGTFGELVVPGSVEALKGAMEKLIANPGLLEAQKNAMRAYKKKLAWDVITRELVEEIDKRERKRK